MGTLVVGMVVFVQHADTTTQVLALSESPGTLVVVHGPIPEIG